MFIYYGHFGTIFKIIPYGKYLSFAYVLLIIEESAYEFCRNYLDFLQKHECLYLYIMIILNFKPMAEDSYCGISNLKTFQLNMATMV